MSTHVFSRLIACVARNWFVYTIAFRILFILQLVFGAGVMLFGTFRWTY